MNKTYTVYMHTTPDGKVYIGATSLSVNTRWQKGKNYKSSRRFDEAIQKYGWDNIKHDILFDGLTKDEAYTKETELIKQYKSNNIDYGYNIESGGNSNKKISEETKALISKALKGKKQKKRRPHTEEEKRAISEKLKGRVSPMKGKHWSEEQRAKVGKAIICLDTGKEYYSVHEASRDTGIDRHGITLVLNGTYKQAGGCKFEYRDKSV